MAISDHTISQDGDTRLKVRRLDVDRKSHLKARAQTRLKRGERSGWTIRGDHDLLAGIVKGVEGVEELFLRLLAPFK